MAAELQTDYLSGKVVYFLLRDTIGRIWNGTVFETYTTANYSTYVITATEQGTASGYYVGNFPSIASGVYFVTAKERIGGSPAEGDFSIGWGAVQWDGSAVVGIASRATPAQVNAEVLDVMNVDVFSEPGQETPSAAQTIRKMLAYLYKAWRNKSTQTGTLYRLYADDGSTIDQKAVVSDDGTTFTREEVAGGP